MRVELGITVMFIEMSIYIVKIVNFVLFTKNSNGCHAG